MELLTKQIEDLFAKYPVGSQADKGLEAKVLVKYFNPYGAGTWIITEAVKEDDDYIMYGYCSLGYGYEFGPVSFNELNEIRVNVFGAKLPLERDLYLPKNCKVKDLIDSEDLM